VHPHLDFDAIHAVESNILELDRATTAELLHYFGILCHPGLKNKAKYEEDKELQLRAFLLEFLVVVGSIPVVKCALSVNDFFSHHHGYIS
jgi:hypothetical protein